MPAVLVVAVLERRPLDLDGTRPNALEDLDVFLQLADPFGSAAQVGRWPVRQPGRDLLRRPRLERGQLDVAGVDQAIVVPALVAGVVRGLRGLGVDERL